VCAFFSLIKARVSPNVKMIQVGALDFAIIVSGKESFWG